jgi:hypothetical protein
MSKMKTTKLIRTTIVVTLALIWSSPLITAGQTASSLTEREIEASETRTALGALLRENANLSEQLKRAESSKAALQKNLATSNAEAEILKRKISELMLRFEALGLDSAGDSGKIEQRLLKAVNDLRLAEQERESLHQALVELTEAVIRFQKVAATSDAETRLALEAATRGASKALGGSTTGEATEATAVAATLTDGLVIAVREDLALVVANIGRNHGVKIGMPFRIVRGDEDLAIVRVVDVREKIAGAVIQDLRSDNQKIQVGDRLKIGADR